MLEFHVLSRPVARDQSNCVSSRRASHIVHEYIQKFILMYLIKVSNFSNIYRYNVNGNVYKSVCLEHMSIDMLTVSGCFQDVNKLFPFM
jgi:hypothetical protein